MENWWRNNVKSHLMVWAEDLENLHSNLLPGLLIFLPLLPFIPLCPNKIYFTVVYVQVCIFCIKTKNFTAVIYIHWNLRLRERKNLILTHDSVQTWFFLLRSCMNLQHQIQCWPHELQDPHLLTSVEPAKVKITDFKHMQEKKIDFYLFFFVKNKTPIVYFSFM